MSYERRHPDPLFVFGALRSGTTLLRLMLKNHSKIRSPGEADYLFDHLHPASEGWQLDKGALAEDWIFQEAGIGSPGQVRGVNLVYDMVDRLSEQEPAPLISLNIHRNISKAAAVFPDAKFIHLLRDPRDVARSSVGMGWNGNSYFGVRHWIECEEEWDRTALAESQVLTVRFEELMQDLETSLSRICAFLELEFEPTMLEYHKTSTYAPPDPGIAQKWRKKAGTREIALIECQAGPIMASRGYAPESDARPPGAVEEAYLRIDNHLRRWRFNIRRYGFGLFVSHHLARVLGLRSIAHQLAARKQNIKIQNLK